MLLMLFSQFCAPCRLSWKFYAKTAPNVTYVKFPGIARLEWEIVLWLTVRRFREA
jgi:hypothetical protein